MKTIKLENKIIYFFLLFGMFLLNIKYLNFLGIIFGSLISYPIILLCNHFDIYKYKIIKFIILLISIILQIFYLNKIAYFISDNILKNYSISFFSLTFLLMVFILGNKGFHTISKVITILSYFIISNIILGIIILIPYININNLSISFRINNLFYSSFIYIIIVIYSYFLIYPITKTKFLKSNYFIFNSFNLFFYFLIFSILNILINFLNYPYITIYKKANLVGFIDRIEIIFLLNYLFIFFILLVIIYYQIKYILEIKLKKKRLNITLIIISLLVFLCSLII